MGRRRGQRQHQSVQHQRGRRRLCARQRRRHASRPSRRPRRRSRRGRARASWSAIPSCSKTAQEILARKEELGALLSREEGKTLPEGIGEVTRAGADLRVLRRRSAAARRARSCRRVRPGRRRRDHARGRRRRRHHHAVEFPDRHPDLEDRAGALLRQHRRVQAGRPGAGLARGRSSISCIAPACPRAC